MVYEEEDKLTREDLYRLRKSNKCKVCGASLNVFKDFKSGKVFLACWDWLRTHHEGIEREAQPLFEPNIPTRREMMNQEYGEARTRALEKYGGVVSLTKVEAMEILQTIWPDAPEVEVLKAAMICHQYGLNPLMKHVFLIPFKRRNKAGQVVGEDWVTVLGIAVNRLLAQRHHSYSYLDMTPRRMTDQEQEKIMGEVDDSRIWAVTKIKDTATGAEAMGIGLWPKDDVPYGSEKGNTKLNMACIRSERQALDRQYPGEMPGGVEVVDETYISPDYEVRGVGEPLLSKPEGEEKIGGPGEVKAGEFMAEVKKEAKAVGKELKLGEGKVGTTVFSSTKGGISPKIGTSAAEPAEPEGFHINLTWLNESLKELKWTHETCKTFLVSQYKVSPTGTLEDVIKRLTREQAKEFVEEIQTKVADKQPGLFE